MRLLRHLANRHRTSVANRTLGLLLAFNAGGINAGGFLVVGMYTSHMTGVISTIGDHLVLGNFALVLAALGTLLFFVLGAASTSILVNWARQQHLHSTYALPLLFEAVLMLLFGLLGALTLTWHTPFAVPITVLLLAYTMGLQNAVITKMSSAEIRTTHMTGISTDIGIELGRALYRNRSGTPASAHVHANWPRLRLFGSLLLMFMLGGVVGAFGFSRVGFVWVVPMAGLLLGLSLPPLAADLERLRPALRRSPPGH